MEKNSYDIGMTSIWHLRVTSVLQTDRVMVVFDRVRETDEKLFTVSKNVLSWDLKTSYNLVKLKIC